MLYAILGRDAPNSLERRLSVRPAHLERLNALLNEGRLILAGPLPAIDTLPCGQTPATLLSSSNWCNPHSRPARAAW